MQKITENKRSHIIKPSVLCALLLSVIAALCVQGINSSVNADAAPSRVKKISMKKGEKYKLKYKKKYSYKNSDKNVVTVSKKGIIKAKKVGTCTIKVMAGRKLIKKYRITVTKQKKNTSDVPVLSPSPEPSSVPSSEPSPALAPEPSPVLTLEPSPALSPKPSPMLSPEPSPTPSQLLVGGCLLINNLLVENIESGKEGFSIVRLKSDKTWYPEYSAVELPTDEISGIAVGDYVMLYYEVQYTRTETIGNTVFIYNQDGTSGHVSITKE